MIPPTTSCTDPRTRTMRRRLRPSTAWLPGSGQPRVVSIALFPEQPTLARAGMSQQFAVRATYSDGTERDVTAHVRPGKNTIEVTVIGTLKNTLGPHHAGTQLGAAWPPMFRRAPAGGLPPGADYATVPYGLTKDFLLIEEQVKR